MTEKKTDYEFKYWLATEISVRWGELSWTVGWVETLQLRNKYWTRGGCVLPPTDHFSPGLHKPRSMKVKLINANLPRAPKVYFKPN